MYFRKFRDINIVKEGLLSATPVIIVNYCNFFYFIQASSPPSWQQQTREHAQQNGQGPTAWRGQRKGRHGRQGRQLQTQARQPAQVHGAAAGATGSRVSKNTCSAACWPLPPHLAGGLDTRGRLRHGGGWGRACSGGRGVEQRRSRPQGKLS